LRRYWVQTPVASGQLVVSGVPSVIVQLRPLSSVTEHDADEGVVVVAEGVVAGVVGVVWV
jgi:hypothetical protein